MNKEETEGKIVEDRIIMSIPVYNGRVTRKDLNISIACLISFRSTCKRGSNGCVITRDNRIIATGYNGSLRKGTCEELKCDVNNKCLHAVHAEENAISFAAKNGIKLNDSVLYCTSSPCYDCAKLIIQSGIKAVLFKNVYETDNGDGLKLLEENHIAINPIWEIN